MSERSDHRSFLGESMRLAIEVLLGHKMRSGLLILGVTIGVCVLMGMVSMLAGLGRKIENEIQSSDSSVVTLSKFDMLTTNPEDERILARPDITPEDAVALEELAESVGVAEFLIDANRVTVLRYGDQQTPPTMVHGGGAKLPYVYNIDMELGRYFNDAEILTRANVATLGYGPAEELFPNVDPIGKRVRIGDEHYEVVGVYAERKSVFGGMGDNFVIIPWTTFKKSFGRKGDPYYVYMTVADGFETEDTVEEARSIMRRRHALAFDEKDDFALISNDRVNEFVKNITGPIGLILVALSSIGLTVGGIGVMNIMLVSVTERTREIGIRMALGARRGVILTQFLIEAGTLTGIGGVLGVALGLGLAHTLARAANFPAVVHPGVALVGVLFSVGIGIFFGMYPAYRASRLDPIEALRYE